MKISNKFLIFLVIILLVIIIYIQIFIEVDDSYLGFTNLTPADYKIPLILHQTWISWDSLTDEIIELIKKNMSKCPRFEYRFYSDSDCDLFIKSNFNNNVYSAYQKISPNYGAARSDFFRYCVLYISGGFYIDIKTHIKKNLEQLLNPPDLECVLFNCIILKCGRPSRYNLGYEHYEQWALCFKPGHGYLLEVINQITNDVLNGNIPKISNKKILTLELTGPDALSRAINNYRKKNNDYGIEKTVSIMKYFRYESIGMKNRLYNKSKKKHYSVADGNIVN